MAYKSYQTVVLTTNYKQFINVSMRYKRICRLKQHVYKYLI